MKSLTKKTNFYRITLEEITTKGVDKPRALQLQVQDRENIFDIVDQLKQGSELDEQSATKVGIALRLLGPVMMQNRKHSLFVDFMPHFKDFMVNLKKTMKNS